MPRVDLHERVIDGDDEDFSRVLELGAGDVAGNVRLRAARAWDRHIVSHLRFFFSALGTLLVLRPPDGLWLAAAAWRAGVRVGCPPACLGRGVGCYY